MDGTKGGKGFERQPWEELDATNGAGGRDVLLDAVDPFAAKGGFGTGKSFLSQGRR